MNKTKSSKHGSDILKNMLRTLIQDDKDNGLNPDKKLLATLLYGVLCGQESYTDLIVSLYVKPDKNRKKELEALNETGTEKNEEAKQALEKLLNTSNRVEIQEENSNAANVTTST